MLAFLCLLVVNSRGEKKQKKAMRQWSLFPVLAFLCLLLVNSREGELLHRKNKDGQVCPPLKSEIATLFLVYFFFS